MAGIIPLTEPLGAEENLIRQKLALGPDVKEAYV
jgi:hypothetical protein